MIKISSDYLNNKNLNDDAEILFANITETAAKAAGGIPGSSQFLSPAEQFFAKQRLAQSGLLDYAFFFGGYEDAERKAIVFLPDYMRPENPVQSDGELLNYEPAADFIKSRFGAVEVTGSRFRTLSHRDYMGSLLSLGIERSVIGDIAVTGDFSAVIFASLKIIPFIKENFVKAASDHVKTGDFELNGSFSCPRSFQMINETAASARLDAVIGALANQSRQKAAETVSNGSVTLNYSVNTKTDFRVSDGDVISISGTGKFIIDSVSELSKKGRARINARKYI